MENLQQFSAQIERIRSKLPKARAEDEAFRVFGSEQHRYALGPPASPQEARAFEARIGVGLPAAYTMEAGRAMTLSGEP
ncbi:hypothetical protein [Maricaulis sp.]|uniref:hypothetical protein n=1 Tax=Maricaulis sp. TaxID=1486257 RepID=UPI00261D0930|nr:hypothetical protein [Maricaulis sp.]